MKNLIIHILVIILYSNTVYAANTGSTTITSSKVITATGKENIVKLTLKIPKYTFSQDFTKIELYDNTGKLVSTYRSGLNSVEAKADYVFKFYAASSYVFLWYDVNGNRHDLNKTYCSMKVPTSAEGDTILYCDLIADGDVDFNLDSSTGWVRNVSFY